MDKGISQKYSDMQHCPIRNVLSHFSTKWGLLILSMLGEYKCLRFNEISKALPDISPKVLSTTLKTLESDGLINRKLYSEVPPKVEYSITPKGNSLIPILDELIKWGTKQMH
ncbi:helix-turn-helix domain-containing protein [uncultured Muribaculum sp.]|uniref:winged helix-turn-helix transcriptional regulator n=1 Tax=uncultured Muribaculum sp. TaxID=1918613 RepID=UPI0025AF1028|nr:helix-turn-helix domain-containing protein [uncultured Muribaculum sp.]